MRGISIAERSILWYNIPMKLYNQISKQVETFTPADPKNVKLYTCGPTVYSYAHIGNFTSYIYWDLLVRALKLNGWTPNRVLNLTDVGHLTSDADEGEDKLEKGARREGKTVWEIAKMYSDAFLQDFAKLNLVQPDHICPATDYIEEQKALVDRLTANGCTYETEDGIYFDTSKFANYADFAHLDLEQLKAGARVALSSEKRNISDFAVWKFIKPGENHAMRWDYLSRPGYPGWHLECSAICHAVLGEPLDIHTGGIDHIPVHHTNEIAQTFGAYGESLARFWLHCNFITIEGEKVSKSLGNTYTLDELAERGYDPLDFKLWVLQGHYQSERNFSFADLDAAKARRLAWRNRYVLALQEEPLADDTSADKTFHASDTGRASDETFHTSDTQETFHADSNPREMFTSEVLSQVYAAVNDNLNSPLAFSLIDQVEHLLVKDWQALDDLFGLDLTIVDLPSSEVLTKITERETARATKDFATADALRAEIEAAGFTILDTPAGPKWQLKN